VKVKLDENLGADGRRVSEGRRVRCCHGRGPEPALDARCGPRSECAAEERCLVTLDRDFSDPLRYPPSQFAGIIVVRLPGRFRLPLLERALALVVEASKQTNVRGRLWIAEVDRIREYQERVE